MSSPSKKGKSLPTKVGLGPVIFNLKPHHYYSSKKTSQFSISLDYYRKKYPDNFSADPDATARVPVPPADDLSSLDSLCKGIDTLSLEQSVSVSKRTKATEKVSAKTAKSEESGKKETVKKSSSGQTRKGGAKNAKSTASASQCPDGVLKKLFCWALGTSTRWKEVESSVDQWNKLTKEKEMNKNATVKEIADLLGISVEQLLTFQIHKDLPKVCEMLKGHCHSSLPFLQLASAISELQQGNFVGATLSAANIHGSWLHGEIIDKHICYISRNDDPKAVIFYKQIEDTIGFGENAETFTKQMSLLNPDWNIIQITALLSSKNRFGMDIISRRQIPQLLLSALSHLPGETERTSFTTYCPAPPVYESSHMRLGLMEEFQKILDRNLIISDESTVISRRNYWEERGRHNEAMKSIIEAMEESWIGPLNFLLPGHTIHRRIQDKIYSKIVTPATKKYKLTSAQRLLLYKLTENYKYLHRSTINGLETVVAFILNVQEEGLSNLCKKIGEIGSEVPLEERHPTILVVDQDLEIYPWESMACLLNTDVTRMPSLNLIRSNYNFGKSLRPTYPNIVDTNSCTFVLNPDGTLPNVQKRLEKYFVDHKSWVPVIGRPPATKEIQECLENQHVFLYNGHGAGSNFYPDYAIQKLVCQAVPLLMGCASAQFHYAVPRVYGSSTIHSYFFSGCPSVVGYLWEITDAECDRVTVDLVERWLPNKSVRPPKILFFDQDATREPEKCLQTAMRKSRKAATQYLTQCAIVCYGLPINTHDD